MQEQLRRISGYRLINVGRNILLEYDGSNVLQAVLLPPRMV